VPWSHLIPRRLETPRHSHRRTRRIPVQTTQPLSCHVGCSSPPHSHGVLPGKPEPVLLNPAFPGSPSASDPLCVRIVQPGRRTAGAVHGGAATRLTVRPPTSPVRSSSRTCACSAAQHSPRQRHGTLRVVGVGDVDARRCGLPRLDGGVVRVVQDRRPAAVDGRPDEDRRERARKHGGRLVTILARRCASVCWSLSTRHL